ncbi:MAG: hypothetical protein ACK5NL_02450, partial [Vibrio fluvialis]
FGWGRTTGAPLVSGHQGGGFSPLLVRGGYRFFEVEVYQRRSRATKGFYLAIQRQTGGLFIYPFAGGEEGGGEHESGLITRLVTVIDSLQRGIAGATRQGPGKRHVLALGYPVSECIKGKIPAFVVSGACILLMGSNIGSRQKFQRYQTGRTFNGHD